MTNTTVNNGQTVNNLDVTNGNFLDVSAGGTADNTTVENGGFLAVEATSGGLDGLFGPKTGGVANGVTVNNGGELELRGSNSNASNVVLNGGNLVVDSTASVTGSLTFGPTTGTQIDGATLVGNDGNFKPTLVGFSASSALDDNAVHFSGATLTTTVSNGNTIATLSGNGVSNTFSFAGTEHLKIVPDNGDDSGPEAIIVTTNTTTDFSALPGTGQASQASTAPALQASHAAPPAMSFLSHPQAVAGSPTSLGMSDATRALAATRIAAATQTIGSIAHAMRLSQGHDLGRSMLGAPSNPTGLTSVEARATIGGGALQHLATAPVLPALTPHPG